MPEIGFAAHLLRGLARESSAAGRIGPGGYAGQVLTRIDLRGKTAASLGGQRLAGTLPRARLDVDAVLEAVRPVCEDVRLRGAAAVRDQTRRFDGVDLATHPRCLPSALSGRALPGLGSADVRAALAGGGAARAARPRGAAACRDTGPPRPRTASTVTERYRAGPAGRRLRARRAGRLPLVGA